VAGSLGYLTGPIVGGVLVEVTRGPDGPAYREIFAGDGVLAAVLAVTCWSACRRLAREVREDRVHAAASPPVTDAALGR
jgi:hypothetical protein